MLLTIFILLLGRLYNIGEKDCIALVSILYMVIWRFYKVGGKIVRCCLEDCTMVLGRLCNVDRKIASIIPFFISAETRLFHSIRNKWPVTCCTLCSVLYLYSHKKQTRLAVINVPSSNF